MTPRICSFESRKANEIRSLIERFGATATIAPSMQEVPLDSNVHLFDFVDELKRSEIDAIVFMTGIGAKTLVQALETRIEATEFLQLLDPLTVIVRGPKPLAVLRNWNVRVDHRVPEPNTWRELVATIDGVWPQSNDHSKPLDGLRFAVQEYGLPSEELYIELRDRGADVRPVAVYRWALPDDQSPMIQAIRDTIDGRFDCLMFTSAQQLRHVIEVAEREKLSADWIEAANMVKIASIGPTASETIRSYGLRVDLEPSHPKMGHLVKETIEAMSE